MEQEISGISKFPEKRATSRGEPKFSIRISGKFLFHSILNRYFRKFWSNGTRPQIQELGLQTAYQSNDGTSKYLRKIMALPFLPPSQIPAIFTRLQLQATTEPLQKFVEYVDST